MPKALHGTTYVLDYIATVAKAVHDERLTSITFTEIHQIIKRYAIRVQATREIEAGKKWRDYRKKSQEPTFMREAADKTASAMVRWGLLDRVPKKEKSERSERSYEVKPRLKAIGEAVSSEQIRKAKLITLDRILRSERESPLTPKLLVRIRDSTLTSYVETEYELPSQGVIQWSAAILRSKLGVSEVDIKMITSWFQALELLNVFNPRVLDVKQAQEIYLTLWIATEAELLSFYSRIVDGTYKIESLKDQSCLRILEAFGAIRSDKNRLAALVGESLRISEIEAVRKSLADPFTSNLMLVGESSKFQGLLYGEIESLESIYVLHPRQPSLDSFIVVLKKYYEKLKTKWKSPYVWIAPLRALCCRSMMISDHEFDDLLTQFYKQTPDSIEFSKAATGIFRKRTRVFEKPFKLYGNPFRMIRLVVNQ